MVAVATDDAREAQRQKAFEKIARLDLAGVENSQIAIALSVSEQTVEAVKSDEGYLTLRAELAYNKFNQDDMIDRGFDAIEEKATALILSTLEWSKDTDFALKALAVVNKANRHNRSRQNRTIEPTPGAHTVIYLNAKFVTQLNGNGLREAPVLDVSTKKVQNFMPVDKAEELLNPEDDNPDIVNRRLMAYLGAAE